MRRRVSESVCRRASPARELLALELFEPCQAATLSAGGEDEVVVATTNVGHLSRFVAAEEWQKVRP